MTPPPNPLARLVGELPNLRERLAKAFAGPWVVNDKHEFGYWNVRQDPENWDGMGYQHICCLPTCGSKGSHYGDKFRASALLIAASPSAHAIAIEAIERLERVEKALTANVTFEEDNGSDEFTDGYWSGVAALRKVIGAALSSTPAGKTEDER